MYKFYAKILLKVAYSNLVIPKMKLVFNSTTHFNLLNSVLALKVCLFIYEKL